MGVAVKIGGNKAKGIKKTVLESLASPKQKTEQRPASRKGRASNANVQADTNPLRKLLNEPEKTEPVVPDLLSVLVEKGQSAAAAAMHLMGYTIEENAGWIVKKQIDGTIEKIEKVKSSNQ